MSALTGRMCFGWRSGMLEWISSHYVKIQPFSLSACILPENTFFLPEKPLFCTFAPRKNKSVDMRNLLYIILLAITMALTGCASGSADDAALSDSEYTEATAMSVHLAEPERALTIIDSAVIVGNLSRPRAEYLKAVTQYGGLDNMPLARQTCRGFAPCPRLWPLPRRGQDGGLHRSCPGIDWPHQRRHRPLAGRHRRTAPDEQLRRRNVLSQRIKEPAPHTERQRPFR